jgi:hypothetical protein
MQFRWGIFTPAVIAIALALRWHTLAFPHDHGDQLIYSGLADNLLHGRAYNLSTVGMTVTPAIAGVRAGGAVLAGYRTAEQYAESLAASFAQGGLDIYDEPLYFHAPAFPALIAGLALLRDVPSVHVLSLPRMRQARTPAGVYRQWASRTPLRVKATLALAQLPATLPPLLASLVIVAATMLWARPDGGLSPLWAGLIMALCCVDVFAAQRVLADSSMTALMLVSLLCLRGAVRRGSGTLLAVAIAAAVCATYVKESAAVILCVAALLMALLSTERHWYVAYAVAVGAALVPWLLILHHCNGRWLPVPPTPQLPATAYRLMTAERTLWRHAWEIPYLAPWLLIGSAWLLHRPRRLRGRMTMGTAVVVAVLALAPFKAFEHRYFLPAYPFIAVAAAWGLEQLRARVNRQFQPVAGIALVVAIITATTAWGLAHAMPSIMGNAGDIFLPLR